MQYQGSWWLPVAPEQKSLGVLELKDQAYQLSLTDSITDTHPQILERQPVIFGKADQCRITVLDAVRSSVVGGGGRDDDDSKIHWSPTYSSQHVVEGQWLEKQWETPVLSATFTHDKLFYWLEETALERIMEHKDTGQELGAIYREPKPLTFSIGSATLEISVQPNYTIGFNPVAFSVQEFYSIKVKLESPLTLEYVVRDLTYEVGRFLSFCAGSWISVEGLEIELPLDEGQPNADGEVTCLFHPAPVEMTRPTESSDPDKVLLKFQVIQPDLGEFLSAWIGLAFKVPHVINLLLSVSFSKGLYIEHRFLSLAQALESFHRWKFAGTHMPDTDWVALSTDIQSLVDERVSEKASAKALKTKLRYLNEISLEERIRALIADAGIAELGFLQDEDLFVARFKETRNYLTHYGEPGTNALRPSAEMMSLCDQMRCLFELCILKEIGLNHDDIRSSVRDNGRYRRLGKK